MLNVFFLKRRGFQCVGGESIKHKELHYAFFSLLYRISCRIVGAFDVFFKVSYFQWENFKGEKGTQMKDF